MKTNTLITIGAVALSLSAATAALALDAASVIKARQDFFHSLGKPFKGLNEEMRKPAPDMVAARGFVADIVKAAPNLPAQFPAGSGPEAGIKTGAKAEIWSNSAVFKQRSDALQVAVKNLDTAAKGDDVGALKTAMAATGQACKACHTDFRKEDH